MLFFCQKSVLTLLTLLIITVPRYPLERCHSGHGRKRLRESSVPTVRGAPKRLDQSSVSHMEGGNSNLSLADCFCSTTPAHNQKAPSRKWEVASFAAAHHQSGPFRPSKIPGLCSVASTTCFPARCGSLQKTQAVFLKGGTWRPRLLNPRFDLVGNDLSRSLGLASPSHTKTGVTRS